ncbi:MAG: hypothetical protein JST92_21025 [Deltaproteobacteria bacterium]|nr:hypothetical protein [Deltaproteobacteria bacterium]
MSRIVPVVLVALAAACGGSDLQPVPPPLASTALPSGADLNPYNAASPALSKPQGMALGADGRAWIALTNLDANYSVAAPGMLVGVVPSTGVTTKVGLGGTGGHDCTNSGGVVADAAGTSLFVTCTGTYNFGGTPELRGRGFSVVSAGSGTVTHHVDAPADFQPISIALSSTRIWVGDALTGGIASYDRTTLALVDGADASHPVITLPCTGNLSVGALLVVGANLYATCSATDGYVVQLDAATGAIKGTKQSVGSLPGALALTGDGRIAVANGGDNSVAMITETASGFTVQKQAIVLAQSAGLTDVRARGNFLYTDSAGTNTVQKIDLAAAAGPKVVAEIAIGDNTDPFNVLPLDDDHAVTCTNVTGALVGVDFTKGVK